MAPGAERPHGSQRTIGSIPHHHRSSRPTPHHTSRSHHFQSSTARATKADSTRSPVIPLPRALRDETRAANHNYATSQSHSANMRGTSDRHSRRSSDHSSSTVRGPILQFEIPRDRRRHRGPPVTTRGFGYIDRDRTADGRSRSVSVSDRTPSSLRSLSTGQSGFTGNYYPRNRR